MSQIDKMNGEERIILDKYDSKNLIYWRRTKFGYPVFGVACNEEELYGIDHRQYLGSHRDFMAMRSFTLMCRDSSIERPSRISSRTTGFS